MPYRWWFALYRRMGPLTRTRDAIRPGKLQRHIDALTARLERLALSKTTAPPRPINRAFNKTDRPEILDEATNHRSRRI